MKHYVAANSEDPDEMQHFAAFHLGLHCLPKYLLYLALMVNSQSALIKNTGL